jgi:hypothetical protein
MRSTNKEVCAPVPVVFVGSSAITLAYKHSTGDS